jgi:hypothetical protein
MANLQIVFTIEQNKMRSGSIVRKFGVDVLAVSAPGRRRGFPIG